jgi:hypothetical protein
MQTSPTPEQALRQLRKLQATDPVLAFKPGPTQALCTTSPAHNRLIEGHNQSGKTTYGAWDTAAILRGIHPSRPWYGPVRGIILVQSRMQAAQVAGRYLLGQSCLPGELGRKPFIPAGEIAHVRYTTVGFRVPIEILMKNGCTAAFAWAGTDATWKRVQGTQFDFAWLDEDAGTEDLMAEIHRSLLVSTSQGQGGIKGPWAGSILWSATPTVSSAAMTAFRRLCVEQEPDYEYFRIRQGENPSISVKAMESYAKALSDDQREVRVNDDGMTAAGLLQVYRDQWDEDRLVFDRTYEPTPQDNIWLAMDPGGAGTASHPTGMLWAAISPNAPRQLKIFRYVETKRQTLDQNLLDVQTHLRGRTLEGFVVDPASLKIESRGKSVYTQILEVMDQYKIVSQRGVMMGRNRHWDGIQRVMRYLKPLDGEPLVQMFKQGEGIPLAIQEMREYQGRPSTRYTGEGGVVKKFDEFPDALRYLISKEPAYAKRGPNLPTWEHLAKESKPLRAELPTFEDRPPMTDEMRSRLELSAKRHKEFQAQFGRPGSAMRRMGIGTLRI